MNGSPPIYRASLPPASYCLRQGEILSNVVQSQLSLASVGGPPEVDFKHHPFAVLLTQDCDLEQDFDAKQKGKMNDKRLPGLLFCEMATAEETKVRVAENNLKQWERLSIRINKNERYHFFQKVDPSCDARQIGLDELVVDFKRYFTLPTEEVYRRIECGEAHRRCVLVSPYLEHLSSRFAYYLSRVALPLDHVSE